MTATLGITMQDCFWKGRHCLVTGASSGIGRAVALHLANMGATVFALARDEGRLLALQESYPHAIIPLKADLRSHQAIEASFLPIRAIGRPVDLLIHAAAISSKAPFLSLQEEEIRSHVETNLLATIYLLQKTLTLLKEQRQGTILLLSSLAGLPYIEKFPHFSLYCATKMALYGLTEQLAREFRPYNISINAVAPGAIDTPMLRENLPEMKAHISPERLSETLVRIAEEAFLGLLNGAVIPLYTNP